MLKNILKLKGVSEVNKNQQKELKGGFWGFGDCPTFCQTSDDCLTDDCGFTSAICATGTCLFFG